MPPKKQKELNFDKLDITEANEKRIKTLAKNTFKDMTLTKTWFNQNLDRIIKVIDEQYDKPSSRCSYYSTLAMVAQDLGGDNDKAYQRFSNLSTNYAVKHREIKETGSLSEGEQKNLHSYENYSIHREIMYEQWQQDKKNNQKMYRSLIMSLLTLYVPLRRSDYLNLKLVNELPKKPTDENFLLYYAGAYKCYLVLNSPSKCKEHELAFKAGTYPLNLMLSKRIIETITAFPRVYLFSTLQDPEEPMSEGSFYKILDGIYKTEVVRPAYVRIAYETFIAKNDFSTLFRKNISKLLLHDLTTAMSFYSRVKMKQEEENDKYSYVLSFVDKNGLFKTANEIGDIPDHQFEYVFLFISGSKVPPKKIENINKQLEQIEDVILAEPPKVIEPIVESTKVQFERISRPPAPKPILRQPVPIIENDNEDIAPEEYFKQKSEPARKHNQPNPKQKVRIILDGPDESEIVVQQPKPNKSLSKNGQAVQKYLSIPINRLKHQAIDYCNKLNKNVIKTPKESTIKKYNLVLVDGKWKCN